MKTKLLVLFGLFLFCLQGAEAQLDTKHWIPPFYAKPGPGTGTSNIQRHFVSLSTPAEDTIPVTIRNGYGDLIDIIEISRNMPMEYTLGPIGNANTDTYPLNVIPEDSLNMPIRSQGLYFESFQPFFVNIRHKSGSQGTSLTSKGQVALGQRFYSGHLYTIYNTGSDGSSWNNERRSHFISVMATEDNTTVTFDLIKEPISYIGQTPGEPITVTLDAFESYVIGVDHSLYDNSTINNANGTRITSDKPIVCNSGSWLSGNQSGQCIGSDQLVPANITGQEYIIVRGLGDETTERPMVVATEDNTTVFLNDGVDPVAVLDEGEFYFVPTSEFSANDNLYVLASENVYMYQTLSGSSSNIGPTVGLNFIPPLNCIGAKEVNLPFVNSLAGGNGQGRINIITKAGTSIFVNESATPLTGAQAVPGINDWVTYAFDPPSDNVIIESDSVMNVALLTRDNNVGTAGYFSGFTLEPVVGLSAGISGSLPCIPGNAVLQVFGFDTYQWYFNGEELEGATNSTLFPEFAGNYVVEGIDLACGFRFPSNAFNIPYCPSTLGAAKSVQNLQETAPGSKIFDLTYRIWIANLAGSPSQNIQIIENINGGLPVGATAELIGAPVVAIGPLSGGVNPDFDGVSDRRLLPGSGSLPGNAAAAIDLVIRVDMNDAAQDGYFNQVTVTSKDGVVNNGLDGPFNGQDFSHDGTNPDPNGNGEPNEEDENDPTLTCFFTNEITYEALSFCVTDTDKEVEIDGVGTGLFTVDNDGLIINSETGTISPAISQPGTYTVTLTKSGRCPTVTTTTVDIIGLPNPGTAAGETDFCITTEEIVLGDYIDGEDEGGVWTDEEGNPVADTYVPVIPGGFEFTYTLTSDPCPIQSESINLNIIGEPLSGTAIIGTEYCENLETVNLFDLLQGEQNGGQWQDAQSNDVNNVVPIGGPGSYDFTYTVFNEACGSRSTSTAYSVAALPNAGMSPIGAAVCAGESVDLMAYLVGAEISGLWIDEDGNAVDDQIVAGGAGEETYVYIVENEPCPADSAFINLDIVQGPNAGTADNPTALCTEDPAFNLFDLLEGATTGGTWTNESGNAVPGIFDPEVEGVFNYTYTVTNDICGSISSNVVISVADANCVDDAVLVPQGFSPNGDGIADQWIISNIQSFPLNNLLVYNRWGNEVFAARPYLSDWNGTAASGLNAGADLPVGTYYYILDLGDGSPIRKGYVYLNR